MSLRAFSQLCCQMNSIAHAGHDGKKAGRRRARSHVQAISHEEEPPAKRASVDGHHDTVEPWPAEHAEDVPQAQAAAAKKGKRRRLEKMQA